MVTFRNNSRRGRFRSNDRNFKRNEDNQKFKSDFSSNVNFRRNVPGRNNHNAPKLVEKYNDLAREALANEDKILSENYFQHADHFIRILNEQEKNRPVKPIEGFHKNEKEVSLQKKENENKEQEKQAASS